MRIQVFVAIVAAVAVGTVVYFSKRPSNGARKTVITGDQGEPKGGASDKTSSAQQQPNESPATSTIHAPDTTAGSDDQLAPSKAREQGFEEAENRKGEHVFEGCVLWDDGQPAEEVIVKVRYVFCYLTVREARQVIEHKDDGAIWSRSSAYTDKQGRFKIERLPFVKMRVEIVGYDSPGEPHPEFELYPGSGAVLIIKRPR